MDSVEVQLERINNRLKSIEDDLTEIKAELAKRVTHERYVLVERIVLGFAGLILIAAASAWIAVIIKAQI